ncbi:MAG: O-acetyl-ADP-ribose deacetylase [Elusimicrobiota bacterium]
MAYDLLRKRIAIINADITQVECDGVVNAANSSLSGGGGVDGAIHQAAGEELYARCHEIISSIGRLPEGKAVITPAYSMKTARFIIHTVGPVWRGGKDGEGKKLYDCYYNSLALAAEKSLNTVAFPAISTGAYFYPYKEAFAVALKAVTGFLSTYPIPKRVFLVFYDRASYCHAVEAFK